MTTVPVAGTRASAINEATTRKAVVAVIVGNGFEWFDFISYSFFAVIIGRLFFPAGDDNVSLLLSVSTIGVGFFMRPFGGILLGALADRHGRKRALSASMILMTIGAALIAFAPTYSQAGLLAPAMIVLARLLQGFSAGGEMGGATTYLMSKVPFARRGYYTSWIQASIGIAIILSAALGTLIVNVLSPDQIESWGWRVPFLFGLLLGPIGMYIRSNLVEADMPPRKERERVPVVEVFRDHGRSVAVGFGLVVFWTVCSHVLLFYMPVYAVNVLKLEASAGFVAVLVGASIVFGVTPLVGAMSDRYGPKVFLVAATLFAAALAKPMFEFVNLAPSLRSMIVFQVVFGLIISLYEGPILAALSRLFPPRLLSTGIAVSYNLAVISFGAFSASTITWLISMTGNNVAPAFYVIATALLSLISVLLWRPMGADR